MLAEGTPEILGHTFFDGINPSDCFFQEATNRIFLAAVGDNAEPLEARDEEIEMPHIHHATATRRIRFVAMASTAENVTAICAVRRFFAPVFLALALIALSVPAGNAASNKESFLLVVQGRIAALSDGAMTMQTPPNAVLFSDRPARRVLPVNLKTFTDALWGTDGSMRRSPPNASIVDENAKEIGVIELTNVSYSGDKLEVHFKPLSGKMPKVGQTVAMTVDGLGHPWSLGGGVTDSLH